MMTTFLQSEVQDPTKIYETMLSDNPVYWDNENKLWAVYSYEHCKAILSNDNAHIPAVNTVGLNVYALSITEQLARLSNGVQHEIARQTAILLFGKMNAISINALFEKILEPEIVKFEIDWVNTICKKLPLSFVLKSFDFNKVESELILAKIETLLKIMLPTKTDDQILSVNAVSKEIYLIAENHLIETGLLRKEIEMLSDKFKISESKILSFAVTNLIGLFIQSYDASRGVLSNSLLQVLKLNRQSSKISSDENYLENIIIETLRFDPPIHNTRRIAVEDIVLNNSVIKKGDLIFLVLASANRDPQKFENPKIFDVKRPNNNENLTFGLGSHNCVAKHFSINLTVKCLAYLFENYKNVKLLDDQILYEPIVNARLPKQILISNS
ncbi:cytochrome P450 [Chryseobacterium oranimense]|uniref:cytochrome P450 n=1 Tax=Chryseobacterium oranimense TaxID=421058 RepID=UPI0021AFB764|nr:cytochrome P450 [Chryseobacterium oranimense]UWX60467.1 cytochrome P450 [Chryseobacterium oranimense]